VFISLDLLESYRSIRRAHPAGQHAEPGRDVQASVPRAAPLLAIRAALGRVHAAFHRWLT
jgi:hypothetical protein